jgi:hypothetical protein
MWKGAYDYNATHIIAKQLFTRRLFTKLITARNYFNAQFKVHINCVPDLSHTQNVVKKL